MLTLMLSYLFINSSYGEIPEWAKSDSIKRTKETLAIVCNGIGPSLEDARERALNSCRASAIQFLDQKFEVNSRSIETESDVALHSEIKSRGIVRNLTCKPEHESIEENDSQIKVWLKCNFGLVDVKSDSLTDANDKANSDNRKHVVSISTLPKCDSILIIGASSNVVRCVNNPTTVLVSNSDKKMIVRASGKMPIELDLPLAKPNRVSGTVEFLNLIFEE